MGLTWKQAVISYVLVLLIEQLLFYVLLQRSRGYTYAHILRARTVTTTEILIFPGSVFIWKRVRALFTVDDGERSAEPRRNRLLECVVKLVTLWVLLCVHLSYTIYWFQEYVWYPLSWFVLLCFGFALHVFWFLFGLSVVSLFVRLLHSLHYASALLRPLLSSVWIRTLLLNSKVQTVVSILASLLVCSISLVGARVLFVNDVNVHLAKLDQSLDGIRLVVLSDLHLGPSVSSDDLERAVDKANELNPDVILITGDLVDGSEEALADGIEPLRYLKAKHGVYFSTGNHEYYYGSVDKWFKLLEELKIVVLHNSNHIISGKSGTDICLIGLDDHTAAKTGISAHGMNLSSAFHGCTPNAVTVVMAHNPKAVPYISAQNYHPDLIVCGHNHAGQIYVFVPVGFMLSKYFYGLYKDNFGTQIFVTSGVHFWGTPLKMWGFAEIAQIHLTTSQQR